MATTFTIDPMHTSAEFVVKHMMISKVRGRFSEIAGTIVVPDTATGVPSEIDVTIGMSSVDTRQEQRDGHLKSADFFDVEQFPTMTFKSTAIKAGSGGEFEMTGDLTMHGVTKPVTFESSYGGATIDPYKNNRIGYEAYATISRKDFGMTFNIAMEAGGLAVSDDVKIELAVEAIVPG